jgi:hypothetical protein
MGILSVRNPRLQQRLGVYRLSLAREVLRQLRVCLGQADGPLTRRISRRHEITRRERLPARLSGIACQTWLECMARAANNAC